MGRIGFPFRKLPPPSVERSKENLFVCKGRPLLLLRFVRRFVSYCSTPEIYSVSNRQCELSYPLVVPGTGPTPDSNKRYRF